MGENREYITRSDEKGSINISEDVISIIAAAAIQDVPGVDGAPNTLGNDIAGFLGKKSASRGVKIRIDEEAIVVDAYIMVHYGYVISDVAKDVQNAVTNSVEAMTGLTVPEVNVHVCGITFDKE
ncbi:MAG: Asp23/Gls24 family envelope stress response protein [Clostridiales bacterium]|nr:Asp23/Gls24 family envelope stress response protein [Clostridiales bacterium]